MARRVAEELVQAGRCGPTVRLRVDLHGVSSFGPGNHHTLIRWEWIQRIVPDTHGVIVGGKDNEVVFPAGVFGLAPSELAEQLVRADSIFERADVIAELGGITDEE
ncbi:MAG: hypothetical protein ACRDY0_13375 [Acidimicrobiales bacterium]